MDSYMQLLPTSAPAQSLHEQIEILGYLTTEPTSEEHKIRESVFGQLRRQAANVRVQVAVATAVARTGNPDGYKFLLGWVQDDAHYVWLRILALRSLINLGYLRRALYVELLRGRSMAMRLEVLRIIGHLREVPAMDSLGELVVNMDHVVNTRTAIYYAGGVDETAATSRTLHVQKHVYRARELEEIARVVGRIGSPICCNIIHQILKDDCVTREFSHDLLCSCIWALGELGGAHARQLLNEIEGSLGKLLGPQSAVQAALQAARERHRLPHHERISRSPAPITKLVNPRESDDCYVYFWHSPSGAIALDDGSHMASPVWIRGERFTEMLHNGGLVKVLSASANNGKLEGGGLHFHNQPPFLELDPASFVLKKR